MTKIEYCLRACANFMNRFHLLFVGIGLTAIWMAFAPAAAAQTEKVLNSFSGNSTGTVSNVIRDSAGNLYGTTLVGGSAGNGAIFKVSPTGTETILYSFRPDAQDGANPEAGLIQDSAGNLYGTTAAGGGFKNGGTVFKIDPAGNFTTLHIFDPIIFSQNGLTPRAGLIIDSAGNLYGTTFSGGNNGFGVVFKLDPTGNITVLHSFMGGAADGANPRAALVRDSAGNFYGTTLNGGSAGNGIVFKLDSTGLETVLHSFKGTNGDGANPQSALVVDSSGNLYGTTLNGGSAGYGIVFKVDPTGLETVLHSFSGTDGATPEAGLLRDSAGNLYGTTVHGGATGNGTVFKLDSTGLETVLYSFTGADGSQPQTSLIQDSAGGLYGTTWLGGAAGGGTIFKLDSTGKETVLFSFAGLNGDGLNPQGGLVRDSAGNLYGTTPQGGTTVGNCDKYCGTIFKVDPTGKKTVLYYFTGTAGDGAQPVAGLTMDPAGNLYGTTASGGIGAPAFGLGTVFKLDSAGHETVLYAFKGGTNGDGSNPQAGLILDSKGNLYGTSGGGLYGEGTVFKLDPAGHETILHTFGTNGDGNNPRAGLIMDSKGNLYGTTSSSGFGGGTVFKLGLGHNGSYTVLHTFGQTSGDGSTPLAGLILDSAGNLYGTTAAGGSGCLYDSPGPGCGIVFKLDKAGHETVLYTFTGTNGDGAHPEAALVMDSAGNLYGTTWLGGATGGGTIFKLDTTGHETVLYSFKGATADGAAPAGIILDSAGNFYGITTGGGTLNKGTVFVFTP